MARELKLLLSFVMISYMDMLLPPVNALNTLFWF